ncbi:MAG: glycosyltransferase [Bacteroidales bacterium]|nr:glycosyltransferase [Bacteroidales bacterium]
MKRKLLVFIEKLTYACATNVYPNSKNLRNFISENKFCKKEKLKIIGKGSSNGIDTDYFKITEKIKKESEKIKKELKIPKNAFIYLFVGRIVKDKGINELINAFKKIKQKKDAYLILVGNYENNLNPVKKDVLNEIKNNENIVEAGYQTDVRPFFAMADVFVFPSYREGFPNVVMQAGAMEIPAIVSNINGCNEIIKDGKNGIIISVKNEKALYLAMNKIYTDTELRKKLKNNCRTNIIKNYERKYIWKELKNEYNNLLKLNNV